MNSRFLATLNLIGVVALAGLCGYQWKQEMQLNRRIDGLLVDKENLETKVSEQEKTIKGLRDDLKYFQGLYAATQEELTEVRAALVKSEKENARLSAECEQLKANIETWKAAVKERDEHIAEANERLKEYAGKINEGVLKYNDLAQKHNEVVELVNTRQKELAQAYKDLDETRRKLYKALGQKVPEPTPPEKSAN
jgi:chromosome segregation ATPase